MNISPTAEMFTYLIRAEVRQEEIISTLKDIKALLEELKKQ